MSSTAAWPGAMAESTAAYYTSGELLAEASFVLDGQGLVAVWSDAAQELFGVPGDAAIGQPLVSLIGGGPPDEDDERLRTFLAREIDAAGLRIEVQYQREGQPPQLLELTLTRLPLPAPHVVAVLARMLSSGGVVAAQLQQIDQRFRALVEQIPAVVYTDSADADQNTLYISPYIYTLVGYTESEWRADPGLWERILHPDDRERVLAEDARTNASGAPFSTEYRMMHRDGRPVWVREESVLVRDETGEGRFWQGVFFDIGPQKRLESELARHAFHDPLTGVPNRSVLIERLWHALEIGQPLALMFVDFDNFKVINDVYGHVGADEIMVKAVERLSRCVSPDDLVARYGGDEFAVLLRDTLSIGDVEAVAQRIVRGFRRPFSVYGKRVEVTLSVGIAFCPGGNQLPEDILRAADEAMYRAKALGKNRYEFTTI